MHALTRDIRFGLRLLFQQPTFTFIALLTLTLAIGVTTAVFSVVNGVLLRPLPFPRADRLTLVFENNVERGWTRFSVAPANFVEWARHAEAFSSMTAFQVGTSVLRGPTQSDTVHVVRATAEYFDVIGRGAALGRVFQRGDDEPGRPAVAVLGHTFWQRRLGGDPAIVGRSLTIDDRAVTIVGVMTADIEVSDPPTEMWLPLEIERRGVPEGGRTLQVLGRLKDGVTLDQAAARLNALADRLARQRPQFNRGWGATIVPLHEAIVGDLRRPLYTLFAAVLLVLLIACANVANLLVARAVARRREIAIRLAVGATRRQVVRQLVVESLLLATIAAGLGALTAVWGLDALKLLAASSLPRIAEITIDVRVLVFALALSTIAGVIFGLAPALHATRHDVYEAVRGGGSGGSVAARSLGRKALVVAETAMAVVLLITAGLFIRSLVRLINVNPGFDTRHALAFTVALPEAREASDAELNTYFDDALETVRQIPGVAAAGAIHVLPFSGSNSVRPFIREGIAEAPGTDAPTADYRLTTPGYFRAMGIPLIRGRDFQRSDSAGSEGVVIINQSFARRFFGTDDPLGRRLRQAGGNPAIRWLTVVGVAGDVRHGGYASEPQPEMYWLHAQAAWGDTLRRLRRRLTIIVRTDGEVPNIADRIRAAITRFDPGQPVPDLRPMTQLVGNTINTERFVTRLLICFAGAALMLALAGTYAVVSYLTVQRKHEWGIRLALGAAPAQIQRNVLGVGLALGAGGVLLGTVAAVGVSRFFEGLLFDVRPTDTVTLTVVPLLMLAVALLASLGPARRAASADPIQVLRAE